MINTINPILWGKKVYPHPGKFLDSGNRCAHDPQKPAWHRWVEPVSKKISHQQKKFIDALDRYYWDFELFLDAQHKRHTLSRQKFIRG